MKLGDFLSAAGGNVQRREGFLDCLTAWASPRASMRGETREAMPGLMKIIASQQIGQAAPWQTTQTAALRSIVA
ncbi:hypothetical protein, partial [Rubripirellula obstinata]|uniref:hypothetical protein n=1 Tax=Rubripirellula obstinata TaxID=406547 RepID=UPI001EE3EFC6